MFKLAPDQPVLDWQYFNELPLKIDFTILSSKQQKFNEPKYMKYLALSIHILSCLFRGVHENYNLRPWPENCIYNSERHPLASIHQLFQPRIESTPPPGHP